MMYESQSNFLKARDEWLSLLYTRSKEYEGRKWVLQGSAYRAKSYDIAFPGILKKLC